MSHVNSVAADDGTPSAMSCSGGLLNESPANEHAQLCQQSAVSMRALQCIEESRLGYFQMNQRKSPAPDSKKK